jgi:hypothetical protein
MKKIPKKEVNDAGKEVGLNKRGVDHKERNLILFCTRKIQN